MSVWDFMPTCSYVADIGHFLSALWCLCETRYQLVGLLQTLGTIEVRYEVCVRLDLSLLVCSRHWAPSKCALMSVWDYLPTWWYVWDIGHHPSAPWVKQRLDFHLSTTLALHLYLPSWMLSLSPQTWLCQLGGWVWHSTNYLIFLQVVVLSSCKS